MFAVYFYCRENFIMYKERYDKIYAFFTKKPYRLKILEAIGKLTSVTGYAAYILLLAYLIAANSNKLLKCVLVPALTFLSATVIRKLLDFPRPYEKYDIKPLIRKNTKGKSFPSRHTVCITIISAAWTYVYPTAGIFMWAVSAVIMIIRPLSGVHFPADVIAGAVFSAVCACIGFLIF